MTLQTLSVTLALPEIFIASMACLILLVGLYANQERAARTCYRLAVGTLLVAAALVIAGFSGESSLAFNGLFVDDPLSDLLKFGICLLSAAVFVYGRQYNAHRDLFRSEYYVLGLFSVCGMMVMASANHLLSLYLGLELMSLCLYAMIAFYREDKLAVESSMKYFVLGALASSILLYGMSLLYGLAGSLELPAIRQALGELDHANPALLLSVVLIVTAVGFKLGAVPFHMWVPDVYQGAPTSTTAFIGAAPKIAAFALVFRLLSGGLQDMHDSWQQMLIILALLSVLAGNVIAIAQDNLKRMLAYSTISHMGFFLFGILAGNEAGYSAALFYVLVYATMSCAAFGLVLFLSDKGFESDLLEDLKGLDRNSPRIALLFLVLMLSMAGIPPMAGFFAKLAVIRSLVEQDLVWVAVIAVLLAVVGAYYYLRVIKLVFFDPPATERSVSAPPANWVVLAANIGILIVILPWIGTLIALCEQVIRGVG
ncbi:MAG: NADH-quinone oxidoreductase subunit NuoN [Gammaproteobacteria bacterium]|nr:NADH-quinone oxidoreductase subunit NuoN [Gammaproteobacteria bacterium]MYD75325.1 NADH-quinone oxidoreductase subunit NuoN [Gammaproteobacteria bacterium]MYJ51978.1 NADH-quinone oxidoreductase subunit NuoN [Gammaproteobacteria bacterium]